MTCNGNTVIFDIHFSRYHHIQKLNFSLEDSVGRNVSDWQLKLVEINQIVSTYIPPFIFIFGILGNILSAIIMSHSMSKSVTQFYFQVLAVADSMALVGSLPRKWVHCVFDEDIRMLSVPACKSSVLLTYWTTQFSSWLLVLISFERCLGIIFPHINKLFCTRGKAKVSIFMLAVVTTAMNGHIPFLMTHITTPNGMYTYCECDLGYSYFCHTVWRWLDLTYYSFLPFVLILSLNTVILNHVIRAAVHRRRNLHCIRENQRTSSTVAILLTLSFSFLILTSPISIYVLVEPYYLHITEPLFWAKMNLISSICILMSALNNSINFILYCLSGSKFRRELVVFCSCKSLTFSTRNSCNSLNAMSGIRK